MRIATLFGLFFTAIISISRSPTAEAQDAAQPVEPQIVDGQLVFPPGVPRYLTETERKWLANQPREAVRTVAVTSPPTGPIHCAAEYETMEAIVLTWKTYTTIQQQMGAAITTTGNADLYVVCDSASVQTSANSALTSAGANMSRVHYYIRTTDTVWVRDYGPRYIFEGDCRALVDHHYNRPRPNDDALNDGFSAFKHQAFYQLGISPVQLFHGGGNYHLDASGRSYCTRLVDNENTTPYTSNNSPFDGHQWTETQIHDIWQTYQGVDTHFFDPFPTSIDSTQHLDMWMQVIGDNKVMISDWPNNSGSTQDVICDNAATYMASIGYTVYRLPAFSVSGTHYTYTNVVICNNLVLLPSYTNTTVSPSNATALATYQSALPGYTIQQVNCQLMITAAGAMHCIASHVPKHRGAPGPNGGLSPTAYLKNFRGGDVLTPGNPVTIQWISDDDVSVSNVDILLSTDGGQNYDVIIASATADDWSQGWTPPNIYAPYCRIKIVARDALGNTGADSSPRNFTINGAAVPGDVSCDAKVTVDDVDPFVQALLDPSSFTGCNINAADVNGDTLIDGNDIAPFVQAVAPI
jgi:agmatine/peptidylarginine deiminase